ncbi:hypothetical protein B0A55_12491 [Friedmanniomyces simplex]|uniref:Insulin-induced gene 2 protein n=1 Tax=Friedmanniomyces simplex TaxID=329884 RepID=A0A4V5NDZ9_9PEZI|nr:hypothetical protein B0A55_12491 [Friedmanniomyces simplex]
MDGTSTPTRTRSILNLTSSTLFGIYQPTGYATDREEPSTPWGTGAETPVDSPTASFDFTKSGIPDMVRERGANGEVKHRRKSTINTPHIHQRPRRGFRRYFLPLAGRLAMMFGLGVLYGLLISHLHDTQEIAPVKLEGINRQGWPYLASWGMAGVLLGEALPWLDKLWAADEDEAVEEREERRKSVRGSGDWLDVVRAIGAFVGVAFAIRKLSWQSTMQLSLTLALANPALWYLLDRSAAGFILAVVVSLGGTGVLLGINPAWVPPPGQGQVFRSRMRGYSGNGTLPGRPSETLVLGFLSQESVGVATWIASVLFVSAVCFGNIGRRLVSRET